MTGLLITVEGFPEKVQRVADAIEDAFPGTFAWVSSLDCRGATVIKIEGREYPLTPLHVVVKATG